MASTSTNFSMEEGPSQSQHSSMEQTKFKKGKLHFSSLNYILSPVLSQISPVASSRSPESESNLHFTEKCSAVHKKRLKVWKLKASLPVRFGIKRPPTKTESDQNRSNLKVQLLN
ncbi:hypothetical protein GQ457_06G017250 [Hibiscus cannabinus]